MGGGKGGSSSSTVSIPPEVLARYNAVNARAEDVAKTPFTPYSNDPNAFVAPLTSTQQAGIANINALQGSATPSVQQGQNLQGQALNTAGLAQGQAMGIDTSALQGISQAQAQGTAYNQAAGQNIGQAMSAASPYMQQMAGLTGQGLAQGQGYLQGATGLTQNAINVGQQYAQQAQPFYYGALGAAQPLNQQAQNYMTQGAANITPQDLASQTGQMMNPYMQNVVQAQQALQQEQDAQQRSALQGNAIAAGAFGGDRAGIAQANLARQQSLANQATLSNLLNQGYSQAQATAIQNAQANRAAQQQGAAQAAAFGQQQYDQQLGLGQALSALGQQQYAQNLGTGSQLGTLGQQGFGQNLQAGAQLGNVGQQLYAQNIGQGQAIQGLGQQQYAQGLQGAQAAAGIGQNIYGMGANLAGLQQTSGMNIGNLGLQNQAAQIAAAQAQMGAGQIQQQTNQAGKTALYNQFLQQQGYPFQLAQFLAGIAEGTGALSGSTTNTVQTGSDIRMKDNVAPVGKTFDGQPIYKFNYKGDDRTQIGLMAQDVEKKHPDAVKPMPGLGGLKGVDYEKATQHAADRGHFYNGGLIPDSMGGAVMPDGGRQHFGEGGGSDSPSSTATTTDETKTPAENKNYKPNLPFNEATDTLKNVNQDIKDLYQSQLGRDADPAGAAYWQRMYDAGMSLDQIKYNFQQSPEYQKAHPTTESLKGQSLAYDPSRWQQPQGPVMNQYGSYGGADFTRQPQFGYGYMQPMMGGYGYGNTYGGGLAGYQPQGYGYQPQGYGYQPQQPSNYGMPNFGSSPTYYGAPDYAGAMQYGGNQYQMSQYQQPQQASGKGPSMGGQQMAAPTASGKGPSTSMPSSTSTPPTAGGKGPSTSSTATSTPPTAGGKGPSTTNTMGAPDLSKIGGTGALSGATTTPATTTPAATTRPVAPDQATPMPAQTKVAGPTSTDTAPAYTSNTAAMNATTNPNTASNAATYLADQAAESSGLPASSFASPVNTGTYTPVDIPVSSYRYTPVSQLPSTSAGYEANLASARANPVIENALQGALAAHIPGFDVAKRGGRIERMDGGRTGYSDGGASAAALKNYIDTMSNNPSLMALAAQQQSSYSGLPKPQLPGPYGVTLTPSMPRQIMTANPQLRPQQTAMGTVNQAAQFGNSVSSLAEGAEKLKNKIQSWGATPKEDFDPDKVQKIIDDAKVTEAAGG